MPEEVLFSSERRMRRDRIAAHLRTVAENLEDGTAITLEAGEESVTVTPPSRTTFEVEVERETDADGANAELSLEFELEWDEDETGDDPLQIE